MRKFISRTFLFIGLVIGLVAPAFAQAQTQAGGEFEISAWIPYWRMEEGVKSILPNLEHFTEVNPFVYTVKLDSTLHEATPIASREWQKLKREAKKLGVDFIPTVMWSNSEIIHQTLSDPDKRRAHIREIVGAVYRNGFDGIDIDYEGKYARTREDFSQFLKELETAMGYDKKIICTIEQRTPLDSRFSFPEAIPADIEYANDFTEINKYCDRVRIMAYDQGRYDLRLNQTHDDPYAPVADPAWVRKVMNLIAEEVDKEKLVIGVPTYGYEYDMFESLSGNGAIEYSRLWSFNPGYALDVADKLHIEPERSTWGEMLLIYPAEDSPDPVVPLPFATRIMVWSDAQTIADKIDLARELGLRGIAIFKIDGGQDPNLWNILEESRPLAEVE